MLAYELRGDVPLAAATMHAAAVARDIGTKITIDMGDAFLIPQCREKLMELFKHKVSIIFANEDEADAFCNCDHKVCERQPDSVLAGISASVASTPTSTPQLSSTSLSSIPPPTFSQPVGPFIPSQPLGPMLPLYPQAHPQSRTFVSLATQSPQAPTHPLTMADIIYAKNSAPNPPPFPEEWLQFLNYTELLVVKRGENGSLAITNRGLAFYCPAYKVEGVLDTNGAGDNFQAGFFYGLFRGLSLPVCLKIGSFIASRVIRRRGAQPHVKISGVEYLI